MERLDRKVDAGGRRRSRRKDQERGQRAQRGKRPEDARAERKQAETPSRRSAKAQGRQRRGIRASAATNSAPQAQSTSGVERPVSFQEHLQQGKGSQASNLVAQATSAKKSAAADNTGTVVGMLQTPLQAQNATLPKLGLALAASAPGAAAPSANSTQPGTTPVVPATAVLENETKKASTSAAKAANASVLQEQIEAQETQRSTQVLRQLRMQLHPGMRGVSIQLAPADLGRLSIRMRFEQGEMHAIVRAESEETLAVLERHLPELEAAFGDQGFEAASFEFVLDQQGSAHSHEWQAGRDVSSQMEAFVEEKLEPALRGSQTLTDIEVDTYA